MRSAFSGLWDVAADRLFPGMALDKTRRPWTLRTFNTQRVENISISFHAYREPQQSTRFGRQRDIPFLGPRTGPL